MTKKEKQENKTPESKINLYQYAVDTLKYREDHKPFDHQINLLLPVDGHNHFMAMEYQNKAIVCTTKGEVKRAFARIRLSEAHSRISAKTGKLFEGESWNYGFAVYTG